jgi:hypothetical protein
MPSFPLNRDKRKWQRYPVLESRCQGELRIENKRYPVQILDESAGGFAVVLKDIVGIRRGMKGLLRAGNDWYEVCIVNVTPMTISENKRLRERRMAFLDPIVLSEDVPKDAPEDVPKDVPEDVPDNEISAAFPAKPQYRVGLRRLRDADNPDVKTTEIFWSILGLRFWEYCSEKATLKFLGLFLGVLALGTVVASFLIWGGQQPASDTMSQKGPQTGVRLLPDEEVSDLQSGQSKTSGTSPFQTPALRAAQQQRFQEVIRHARGAAAFLQPEVIEELQLTNAQREAIQAIAEDARGHLETLRQTISASDAPGQYAHFEEQVFSQACEKALQLLTKPQQKRWNLLAGEGS